MTMDIPMLLINEKLKDFGGAQFYFDDYGGAVQAAQYLISKGHRKFGVITGRANSPAGEQRVAGFLEGARQAGIEIPKRNVVPGDFIEEVGYEVVEHLIRDGNPPTAIFCCHDYCACGAIKKLNEKGYIVPDDISVMGFSGFHLSPLYYPRLTTMTMDLPQMGRKAGNWLIEQAHRRAYDQDYKLEPYVESLPVKLTIGETA
jgi:DNA-binding LacI/PurR family transcriptional regulator